MRTAPSLVAGNLFAMDRPLSEEESPERLSDIFRRGSKTKATSLSIPRDARIMDEAVADCHSLNSA